MEKDSIQNSAVNEINPLLLESLSRDAKRAMAVLDELSRKADWLESEEDIKKFAVTVHGIKSPLKNVGQSKLSESASMLEQACREMRIDYVASSAPAFLDELRTLITDIESKQSLDETSGDNDEDAPDLLEKLLAISEQCEEYNRRGVLNMITEIESCSAKTRAVLKEVKDLAMQSDFEDAEKAIAAYISELS